MKAAEAMNRSVVSCAESDPIELVAQRMRDSHVGFLPVRDEDGRITGAITDRDITVRIIAEGKDYKTSKVGDAMTREVYFCSSTDPLKEVEDLMARRKIQRVMVIDDGTLVGVVSLSDLSKKEWGFRVARTLQAVSSS